MNSPKRLLFILPALVAATCKSRGIAVARNLCAEGEGGGGWGGASRRRKSRGGSGGMLPQKILKFRSPEMPFPEAISSSYLIQVMIF